MNKYTWFLFGILLIAACSQKIHLSSAEVRGYEISNEVATPSEDVAEMIQPYKIQLDDKMNAVIGEVAVAMEKGKPESRLCNWVADAIFTMTNKKIEEKVDFAIQNYGGIRVGSIAKGPLTVGEIYELMPFDNIVSIIEMPGNWVDTLVNSFARSGGWPVSKQLNFEIDQERQARSITVNGQPIVSDQMYQIAMPDYIANGGDQMPYLTKLKRTDIDYLIRDVLIDFAKQETAEGKSISGELDGRIKAFKN